MKVKQQCGECGTSLVSYPDDADLICYECFAKGYQAEQPQTQSEVLDQIESVEEKRKQ